MREARLHLIDAATAHGFGAVLPESFGISASGRGERSRAYTFQIFVLILDREGRSIVSYATDVA